MKNSLKQIFNLLLITAVIFTVSSCGDDDDPQLAAPSVTGPSSATEVQVGTAVTVTFSSSIQAGFASASVTAVNGSATIASQPAADATSGDFEVEFTAGTTAGAGSVTLRITDAAGNSGNETAVMTVLPEVNVITITESISSDVTWETGKTYILADRIYVNDGATLTIEPGVVVKGQVGSGANATVLVVARGAKLDAQGTADSPIIFTSIADEIEPGQIASPNLLPTDSGLWGGVIVLGRAPISADADAVQIEGIPPSDTRGLYGGSDAADNSGIIKYISIRHGGTNIGEGNEINGLTLGGVGTGTVVENVEVIGNVDDGIEIFGGSVNVENVLIWNSGDDSFDFDQAWTGTINNIVGILGPDSDHAFELDGPEGSASGTYTITNGSIKGSLSASGGEYADFRDNLTVNMSNIYFFNFKENSDFELDDTGSSTNYINGDTKIENLEFNVSHLSAGNRTIADIFKDTSGQDAFTVKPLPSSIAIVTTPTVGATISDFSNWTWADVAGELDDF